jgi:hypothetical protein
VVIEGKHLQFGVFCVKLGANIARAVVRQDAYTRDFIDVATDMLIFLMVRNTMSL